MQAVGPLASPARAMANACYIDPIRAMAVAGNESRMEWTAVGEGWARTHIAGPNSNTMAERPGLHEQRQHGQGLPPARTPKNGWLMPTFNPQSTGESPVFLPVLTVRCGARGDSTDKL